MADGSGVDGNGIVADGVFGAGRRAGGDFAFGCGGERYAGDANGPIVRGERGMADGAGAPSESALFAGAEGGISKTLALINDLLLC